VQNLRDQRHLVHIEPHQHAPVGHDCMSGVMNVTLELPQVRHLAVHDANGASHNDLSRVDAQSGSSYTPPTGQTEHVYPKRFPVLNSDTARQSPWSGKMLLSLGKFSHLAIEYYETCVVAD